MFFSMYGYSTDLGAGALIVPILTALAGVVLLAVVVATGRWSSAGMLVSGVFAIITLALAMFPGLLLELYRAAPSFLPREWVDGLFYGLAMIVYTVLAGMGIAIARIRRRPPRSTSGFTVGGFVAAPLLLLIGGYLMMWGSHEGQMEAARTFDTSLNPVASLAILGGAVITVLAISATIWSRQALIVPAVVLLLLTVYAFLSLSIRSLAMIIPGDAWIMGLTFFLMGGGVVVAIAQLTFTVVAGQVARRAAAFTPPAAGAWMTPDAGYPQNTQYPDAPPYVQNYPGPTGGQGYPNPSGEQPRG